MRPLPVLCLVVLLAACARTPDEERIREAITAMQTAAEAREPRSFLAHVADDFTGNQGMLDRNDLANLLRAELLQHESVRVAIGPIDIAIAGDRATARFTLTLTGGNDGWLPEQGSVYTITSGWRRKGRDWICYNASWKQRL